MSLSTPLPPCSILILCGGRGQRMGGRDKGLVEWQGLPLVEHVQRQARPQTDDLIISCNRNHPHYARYADHLVSDEDDSFPGPLAGIRAGLAQARHDYLLVLPCDAPLIDQALLEQLRRLASQAAGKVAMVRRQGFWEPLFCVLPKQIAARLEHAWQNGERSPRQVFLEQGVVALDLADDDPRLANLNSPQLLAEQAAPSNLRG